MDHAGDRFEWDRRTIIVFWLLALLVGLAYGNSLWNGFVYDDRAVIVENKLLIRLGNLPGLFTSDYWAGGRDPYGAIGDRSLYRPLVLVSYALNYAVGGLNPIGYHLVNLLLHLLVTWLVYLLAFRLRLSMGAAVAAAAIFAVHPLHTEAVTGIVGRAELLMALGVLGSLWWAATGRRWLSLAAFAFGLFSKEQAVMLPVLLALYDLCRRRPVKPLYYGGYALVLAAYLLLRSQAVEGPLVPPPSFVENPAGYAEWYPRLLTVVKVAGVYLWLCVWPASLAADYSYNAIPLARSPFEPGVLLAALAWGGLLGVTGWSFVRGERRTAFCVGLTVIAFVPVSNLLIPIGTIMGERLFYLPSAGLCLLAGLAYERATGQQAAGSSHPSASLVTRHWSLLLVILICLAMTARTALRNRDWVSNEALFRSAVHVRPDNAKAHAILGHELKDRPSAEERERAIEAFRTALRIYPDYLHHDSTVTANLGNLLFELGKREEAFEILEQAVVTDPEWGVLHYNLGLVYVRDGQYEKAEAALRRALSFNPEVPLFRSALSRFLIERGRFEEGLAAADAVLRRDPEFVWALYNRALALEALGRLEEAAAGYERVRGLPSAPEAARQDAERKVQGLRARIAPGGPAARPCIPGLAGC